MDFNLNDIVLENVSFAYEKKIVLENISFKYDKEDFLAIIGPNGGGKSTLLKLILGLITVKSGKISVFGQSPQKSKSLLAYVPQNTNSKQIFPITCLEVALMGRLSKKGLGFYSKEDKKKAFEALEKVGVKHLADENISNLSGGQRQRVLVARALCSDAKIILLDEPTASIDTQGQIQIYKLLKKLNENVGIIIVSHNINVISSFSNKIAHVNKTLFLHDNYNDEEKRRFLENIDHGNGQHICPIEIISHQHKE